ncbi:MAG: topoisomerase [Rhodocyclales bacterium]|nr:topoisomerase [Rhodocyclales bacterium]
MLKKLLLATLGLLASIGMAIAAVNINTATEQELDSLPGVGPAKAKAIVEYRKANGNFKSVDDLKNVKGIGDKTFADLKSQIAVSGATTAPAAPPAKDKKEVVKDKAQELKADTKAAAKETAGATKSAAAVVEKKADKAAAVVKEKAGDAKDAVKADAKAVKGEAKSAASVAEDKMGKTKDKAEKKMKKAASSASSAK